MTDPVLPPPEDASASAPAPLVAAAALAALEGLLLVLYGVVELAALESDRAVMGASTALFFLVYGGGLAFCAAKTYRRESWARSPVVMAQLIQLGVAWSFWGGASTPAAVGLGVVALVVLAGIFHPASIAALSDEA